MIALRDQGLIKSENFVSGSTGFQIKADGNAEFNNAIFRGILAADQIRITGSVTAGNNYILRKITLS
jgi:hypothetical protein